MRWRLWFVEALLEVNTRVAAEQALEHLLEMLWLNERDFMSVGWVAAPLLLRLGMEQECYDFCKW